MKRFVTILCSMHAGRRVSLQTSRAGSASFTSSLFGAGVQSLLVYSALPDT